MSKILILSRRGATARARNDALAAKMHADYVRGLTMEEVGRKYGGRTMSAVFSLFKRRGLARRRRMLPQVWQKVAATRRAHLDPLIAAMHADYLRPMSLSAVARKYGRPRESVRGLFVSRGLPVRTVQRMPRHLSNGRIAAYVPLTRGEIEHLLCSASRMIVPDALKFEWRKWSLERRRDFVQRLRARLALPDDMPQTPLSAGLEAFAYGHPRAHAIMARENAGCGSHPRCSIKMGSQGVIYRDQLWFWTAKAGYQRWPWSVEHGRPLLHHVIFEETHGPIPRGSVLRFADGNRNNLDPENLVVATRNEVARENHSTGLTRKSRAMTAMLLNRAQHNHHEHIKQFQHLHQRPRAV